MTNKHDQKQKQRHRKKACERYQNPSTEEKDKKQKKVQERLKFFGGTKAEAT